jgi:hypothetical protein
MQHPHRRWEGFRGDPWVNGLPEPERARGQAPADKAENREKTLEPLLGETRVIWRQLDCLKSNAHLSMEGLWRQHLTARWTLHAGKRTACAPSEGPAPCNEYGKGWHVSKRGSDWHSAGEGRKWLKHPSHLGCAYRATTDAVSEVARGGPACREHIVTVLPLGSSCKAP